ncbi:MAG: triose-phosphate isomerase [Chloroflexi bacterium]|nr:triose-phosphate isomerase [Chloroflexota bacterium]
MRKPFIAGNWKMHKTIPEAVELVTELRPLVADITNVQIAVCPPYVALPAVHDVLLGSNIAVGAQNMFWEEEGAYTGEISPRMLKDLVTHVIIGHSERRKYFGETDETVNRKVHAALAHGLLPIICVGEVLEEREAGKTEEVVRRQVMGAYKDVPADKARVTTIAYEPVWAIGTGKAATPEDANHVIGHVIRATLAELYDEEVAQRIRVQYGGSVKPANIAGFMAQPEVDGALVGGASLKAETFAEIIRIASHVRK